MALNLSGLSQASNAATGLAGLILVTPQQTVGYQPQNAPSWKKDTSAQPPAIIFNYEAEQSVTLTADITDHFVEDNTALQDNIAIKPITITTQGFVGELNNIAPAALQPVKQIAEKLTAIQGFLPQLSATALIAYNKAFTAYTIGKNAVNAAVSVWSSINGGAGQTSVINGGGINIQPNQTQQQIYFQQFYAYFQNRTLFTIQTPWAIFQDMSILNLRAVQDAETQVISDFEVTFKQLRFASTQIIDQATLYGDNNNMQGRKLNQGSKTVDLGTNSLTPSTTSFGSVLGL